MKDPEQTKKQLKDEIKKLQSQIKELQKENDRVKYISETKKADLKLQEGEEKFRSITEQMSDMIFLTNEMGIITFISPASEALFGYKTEEMEGTPFTNFLEESQIEYAVKQFQLAVTTNSPTKNLELKMKHKDGSLFFGELTGKLYQSGDLIGTIGVIRDITERKQAEAVLKKSEAKLRDVLDATPFPIAVVDLQDDKILFWSKSAYELFGHTAPTAPEWYKIAYPDSDYRKQVIERWKPILEKSHELGQTVNAGEYNVTCRDGSVRICELYAKFISENLIVTFNDITEKKEVEAALLEQMAFQKNITDTSPIGIVRVDAEGQITFANPEAEIILGLEKSDIVNRTYNDPKWSITDFYGNDFPEENLPFSLIKKYLKPVKNIRHAIKYPDGKTTYLSINASPELNENGQFSGMVATLSDITESKKADEKLRKLSSQLQAIFDFSPLLISEFDINGRYLNTNKATAELYKKSESWIIGKTFSELLPQDTVNIFLERINRLKTSKKSLMIEDKIELPEGDRYYLTTLFPLFDSSGEISSIGSIAHDITERKKAIEEIETLWNVSPDLICVADFNSATFIRISPSFTKTLGFSEEDLLGKPFLELVHPEDVQATIEVINEKLKKGVTVFDFTNRYRCMDGSYKYLDWISKPIKEKGITYAIARDVTEQVEAEKELKKKMHDLEIFNDAAVGRELKINELRKEINELLAKLGKEPKYKIIT